MSTTTPEPDPATNPNRDLADQPHDLGDTREPIVNAAPPAEPDQGRPSTNPVPAEPDEADPGVVPSPHPDTDEDDTQPYDPLTDDDDEDDDADKGRRKR